MVGDCPRNEKTPTSEAGAAVEIVRGVYIKFAKQYLDISESEADEKFLDFFAVKYKSKETDGDKELEEFYRYVDGTAGKAGDQFLSKVVEVVISFAIQAKRSDNRDLAWSYAVSAAYWAASIQALDFGEFVSAMNAKRMAQSGAAAKLASDPRQAEKGFIKECWNEWQQKPDSYASQAAFARDMLSKCEHLTSQKKIEDWCREWKQRTSPS